MRLVLTFVEIMVLVGLVPGLGVMQNKNPDYWPVNARDAFGTWDGLVVTSLRRA